MCALCCLTRYDPKAGRVNIAHEMVPGTAYIRGCPGGATSFAIKQSLERFGEVTSCRICFNKETREPTGCAFADFADENSIKKIVEVCRQYSRGKGSGVPCAGVFLRVDPALTQVRVVNTLALLYNCTFLATPKCIVHTLTHSEAVDASRVQAW